MRQVRKFLGLSAADRRLVVETALLLWAIRLGLWLLPFRTVRRILDQLARKRLVSDGGNTLAISHHQDTRTPGRKDLIDFVLANDAGRASLEQIAWAVAAASRCVPVATCLVQALAAQVLLGRRGHPVELHIGVARGARGRLEAHAWVESRGRVVIGGVDDLSRYTRLLALEEH